MVEFLSKKAAEAKVPKESDINIEKMQTEFMKEVWETGNQLTTNLFGEFSIKQNPKPVMNVPRVKKKKL